MMAWASQAAARKERARSTTERAAASKGERKATIVGTLEMILEFAIVRLPEIIDLAGAFAFAASGAILAVERRLDLFGVLALAFVAASAGSVVRDELIGAIPPAVISDWRYLAISTLAGSLVFLAHPTFTRWRFGVELLDAVGLALGAVAGAQKALAIGINPPMAATLGMLGGVGGGAARDILVSRTPAILRQDLYAIPALLGASLAVVGRLLNLPLVPTSLFAAAACLVLRLVSTQRGWSLPVARPPPRLAKMMSLDEAQPGPHDD